MSNSNDERKWDDVLKRMLATPPQPHKPKAKKKKGKKVAKKQACRKAN